MRRIRSLIRLTKAAADFDFSNSIQAHDFAVAVADSGRVVELLLLQASIADNALAHDGCGGDLIEALGKIVLGAEQMAEASTRQFLSAARRANSDATNRINHRRITEQI